MAEQKDYMPSIDEAVHQGQFGDGSMEGDQPARKFEVAEGCALGIHSKCDLDTVQPLVFDTEQSRG